MAFFDFESTAGKSLLGTGDDSEVIKREIEESFEELPIDGLVVEVTDDVVLLAGVAKDFETREKSILIAGNIEGIAQVNADQLVSMEMIANSNAQEEEREFIEIPEEIFYTIEEGDTLLVIATKYYDDGSKYTHIVDANIEVIKNADLIYAGQTIRIPEVLA
ncbi:MAG TPA: LysM peptidoglycan-binding domain-containing protein [Campylobacterales bacterium]|nr:LysM peptidoglycan-binding domain-containing protein [Campylobacterales bacterium]